MRFASALRAFARFACASCRLCVRQVAVNPSSPGFRCQIMRPEPRISDVNPQDRGLTPPISAVNPPSRWLTLPLPANRATPGETPQDFGGRPPNSGVDPPNFASPPPIPRVDRRNRGPLAPRCTDGVRERRENAHNEALRGRVIHKFARTSEMRRENGYAAESDWCCGRSRSAEGLRRNCLTRRPITAQPGVQPRPPAGRVGYSPVVC